MAPDFEVEEPTTAPPEAPTVDEAGRAQIARRVIIALATVVAMLAAAEVLDVHEHLNQQAILGLIAPLGVWGPFGFLALFVLVVLFSLPSTAMVIAGGALFGFWGGLLFNAIGLNAGAIACFAIARRLGPGLADRWRDGRFGKLLHDMEHRGTSTILLIRLSGLFPLAMVNYGAGLARVPFKSYVAGTVAGLFPGMVVYTYLGASIASFEFWQIALALGLLGVLALATLLWRHTRRPSSPSGPSSG